MSGFVNDHDLKPVKAGDRLSAKLYSLIIKMVKRTITGPNVTVTAYGWHIRRDNIGRNLTAENPDQVGDTSEEELPLTDSWDQADQGEFNGVIFTKMTRQAYNPVGDEKLYALYRDLKFDVNGRLMTISGETRVAIDTPEECP